MARTDGEPRRRRPRAAAQTTAAPTTRLDDALDGGGHAVRPPPPPTARSATRLTAAQPQSPPPEPPGRTSPSSPWSAPPSSPAPPKPIDLTIPLATLLGPRRRPGESHGFGPLDPALSRALAALAAASPHTTACVTVTDQNGHAIGHGCLSAGRRKARLPGAPDPPLTALPAHLNLTITATRLPNSSSHPDNHAQPGSHARPAPHRRPAGPSPRPPPPPHGARPPPRQHRQPAARPARPAGRPALVPDLDHHPAQRPAIRRPARARPHPRLRPPPGIARLRAQRRAPPPGPDPRPRVHPPDLLPSRERVRLRARRPLRPGRTHLRVQRRSPLPRLPPGQAVTRLESHPAQTRLAPMGNPQRPHLHPRTQPIPHLTSLARLLPDIHGEHGGVAQHEHLETGIWAGGSAVMLTVSPGCSRRRRCSRWRASCGKPGCLDRLRRAQLDAAALAMMSPVGIAPPRLGWTGPCAPLRTVTTGPCAARYPPFWAATTLARWLARSHAEPGDLRPARRPASGR